VSAATVPHVATVPQLREIVRGWRKAGERVALVPTMGALHGGHLELIKLARRNADRVVASIFVNPAQFAPHEDLDRYPRTFDADLAGLATVACDLVWAPAAGAMYPEGFATRIVPAGAATGLETDFRPHFFGGVTTVCAKLFLQVAPDYAIFGEKDFQQLAVIRQMVRDLDMPLEIVGAPTIREADGLAMSSRNRYLSPVERQIAPAIHRTLSALAGRLAAEGAGLTPETAEGMGKDAAAALSAAGFAKIDYVAVRDAVTLAPIASALPVSITGRPMRVLAAVWLGKTRLIDNIAVV
jgi:pantoate--beta-alanine ligase